MEPAIPRPDPKSTSDPPSRYRDRGYPRVVLEPQQIRQIYKGQSVRKVSASDPRGVVLPLVWRRWATGSFSRAHEHYTLLRKSLLYWDEIVWPLAEFMNPADGEDLMQRMLGAEAAVIGDLRFLESAGILEIEKTSVMVNRGDPDPSPELISRTEHKMFLNRDHWEPGIWALADTTNEFECPNPDVPITRAALFRLVDVLPAPRDDVPFQDILEFKEKYKDELRNLRARLDSLYSQIAPYQETVALRELDKAIADLNTAANFSPTKFIRSSLTAILDLGEHIAAPIEITREMNLPATEQLV